MSVHDSRHARVPLTSAPKPASVKESAPLRSRHRRFGQCAPRPTSVASVPRKPCPSPLPSQLASLRCCRRWRPWMMLDVSARSGTPYIQPHARALSCGAFAALRSAKSWTATFFDVPKSTSSMRGKSCRSRVVVRLPHLWLPSLSDRTRPSTLRRAMRSSSAVTLITWPLWNQATSTAPPKTALDIPSARSRLHARAAAPRIERSEQKRST
mmetsp:Transcript_27064/g.90951  ORF Transcript_27064/g.90951 Transcript_27064/m.90951 type:complete len:211 (-) Transcript_27064:60-692(-)